MKWINCLQKTTSPADVTVHQYYISIKWKQNLLVFVCLMYSIYFHPPKNSTKTKKNQLKYNFLFKHFVHKNHTTYNHIQFTSTFSLNYVIFYQFMADLILHLHQLTELLLQLYQCFLSFDHVCFFYFDLIVAFLLSHPGCNCLT